MTTTDPLLLYVHIPYCVHKCHYCDFNSHVRDHHDWDAYQQALLTELEQWSKQPQFSGRQLQSIFFGGGTPSLAPSALIASVIDAASYLFKTTSDIEITLEANPGTVDQSHFAGFRQAGVSRLSIGLQSLNDGELKWLQRIHSGEQAIGAFTAAREAGFENINLDLMYGLPDQTMEEWMESLNRAIDLNPEHLSCYQLTVEAHTKLAAEIDKVPDPLPDDDLALQFLYKTRERLAEAGYEAYEISNFSRPGLKCHHNDGYWLYRDYIGIGAGASGKWDHLGEMADGGVTRYSNIRNPEKYMESVESVGSAINSDEVLLRDTAAAEALWQGLRRTGGVSDQWFSERFGVGIQTLFGDELAPWLERHQLIWEGDRLHLTDEGLPFADSISEELF
ncbi:MAG: radical SAM family heme chaperone HemW [Mariprofundaceae bacterium]|nr:radical SAM family heme chaperone HemW [Mariprofundaceae bacterium]